MNKKIKVIEIFNIISNGDYEALPLNIEVDGKKYKWDILEHFYSKENGDREDLLQLSTVYDTITFLDMNAEILDKVEDNTEEIEELDLTKKQNIWDKLSMCEDKINELVKVVKEIRKDLNKC